MKSDLNFLHAVFAHEIADFVGMMAFDDNLMIANGMTQKIRFQVGVKQDLCATKMLVVINWYSLHFGDKKPVQFFAPPFKQGVISAWQITLNGNAN